MRIIYIITIIKKIELKIDTSILVHLRLLAFELVAHAYETDRRTDGQTS